jgi:gas vesicle protein
MAGPDNRLPEGTDTIINGAGAGSASDLDYTPAVPLGGTTGGAFDAGKADYSSTGDTAGGSLKDKAASAAQTLRDQATEKTADLRGQATDKARDFAVQGKDRATAALDNVSKLISDAAAQVDEKVGSEYGDYARRAQEAVDDLAQKLRDKDVDALFADARELVSRSPGVAISAAAVIGFALVRVIRAGLDGAATTATGTPSTTTNRAGNDTGFGTSGRV